MRKLRVMSVFGTRPEAIKLAPVIQLLEKDERFEGLVVVTAQHREMLDQVLDLFDIHPHIDLNLMTDNQTLADLTASVISALDPLIADHEPDWLLVQGDTTTVMAAGLCAYYRLVKVAHVEAGLRTGNKWAPFPEEINRRIATAVADLHFAPTEWAKSNLLREGIPVGHIRVTGNTIIDAQRQILAQPMPAEWRASLEEKGILSGQKSLVMVTAHRRENFGAPIRAICSALKTLAEQYLEKIEIMYPVHLNPHIQGPVYELLGGISNLTLLPPLEYLALTHLLKHARLILTDSGGIQEEATGLGVPCLVLRDVTERPEGVEAGVLQLVGTQPDRIMTETRRLLDSAEEYHKMARAANPYGDGQAAERIMEGLAEF